jgi:hypothetical protein
VSFYNFEMDLPTVVLDMPELDEFLARRRAILRMLMGIAVILFVGMALLIYRELTVMPREMVNGAAAEVKDLQTKPSVRLSVTTVPPRITGAVITVDGEEISGDPPYVYLKPSESYHSIRISAPGYEVFSKDVQIGHNEMMTFSLVERESRAAAGNSKQRAKKSAIDFDFASELPEKEKIAIATRANVASVVPVGSAGLSSAAGTARTPRGLQPATRGKPGRKHGKSSAGRSRPGGKTVLAEVGSGTSDGSGIGTAAMHLGGKSIAASLIINAPVGLSQRVKVSVDGKMRGYLPVLLKVDPGLHELAFSSEGRRTFQMVKLGPGQISRVVPQL